MVMTSILPQGVRLNPRNTFEVCEGMSIQAAINAAAAQLPAPSATNPWTVLIYPGIYTEVITCSSWVNLKGIGPKGSVVIYQLNATIVTLANNVEIQNLAVRLGTPTAERHLIQDNAVACNARLTDLVMEITAPTNIANLMPFYFTGAGDYTIERCSGTFTYTGNAVGHCIHTSTNAATLHLIDNDFTYLANTAAIHIFCAIASVITGGGNRWAGTGHMWGVNAGTVVLNNDAIVTQGDVWGDVSGGSVTMKNGRQQYEVVWPMMIQHAITAAAADTPAPSASAPYTVLIHPGIYTGALICSTWVNLRGIGPRGSVVIYHPSTNLVLTADNIQMHDLVLRQNTAVTTAFIYNTTGVAHTCRFENIHFEVLAPGANQFWLFYIEAGGTYTIERCSSAIAGTGNSYTLRNAVAGATFILNNNDFSFASAAARHILSIIGGGWRCMGNTWGGGCGMFEVAGAGTLTLDNDAVPCTGPWTNTNTIIIMRNCAIGAPVVAGDSSVVRLKNCSYRTISRTGTGNIVDESPYLSDAPWHVEKWDWQAVIAQRQVAVRGNPQDGGGGQVLLEVDTAGVADAEAVETFPAVAGTLANNWTPAYTPRFLGQIAVDTFHADADMFFGLRETLQNSIPDITAEECAGFDWNGANFRAISSDGGGAGVATGLATPSVDVQHQLEVIVFGGKYVEFYVDGVLVATHSTAAGMPTVALNHQHLLNNGTGGGGAGDIDVTVRNGGCQECPA